MADTDGIVETDVLIIGAGLAGIYASIKAKELGAQNVLLVDKGRVGRTGMTVFGAGVMLVKFPADDPDAWLRETYEYGEHVADQNWIRIIMDRSYEKISELVRWGVEFKMKGNEFARCVGRGQRADGVQRNIMFNGIQLMDALRKKALSVSLKPLERIMVTDLLTHNNTVVGAVGFNTRRGEFYVIKAKATIHAAGSNAYKGTFLGHRNVTGDSWAMMARVGAEMISLEFATANSCAKDYDLAGMNMLVALGGKFINREGEPFMLRYDQIYGDRAVLPRLTAAMAMEVKDGRGPIYLDLTSLTEEDIQLLWDTNPMPMSILRNAGVDVRRQPIEWMPAMIGFGTGRGGGARIDTHCETNLPGLYAIGDAAWAAFQGTGGAGGPNFPFCVVSGEIAVQEALGYIRGVGEIKLEKDQVDELRRRVFGPLNKGEGMLPEDVLYRFQEIFFKYDTWLIRRGDRLEKALREVERIRDQELPMLRARDMHELRNVLELKNMITVAEMQLRAAIERTESRGASVREDYPESDDITWLKWVVVSKEGEKMRVRTVDIPIDQCSIQPERKKFFHPIFAGAQMYKNKGGA